MAHPLLQSLSSQKPRLRFVLITILVCCVFGVLLGTSVFTWSRMASGGFRSQLDRTAALYRDLGLFSGVASVRAKQQQFSKPYGQAHIETGTPLRTDHIFPIASVSKSFTAVAVHQLIEQGLIGWDDPASKYMRPADFGRSSSWCPRVYGQNTSDCTGPTVKQLLSMSSGLIDQLNCPVLPWESEEDHCLLTNDSQQPGSIGDLIWLAKGDVPAAWWFARASYEGERIWMIL